MYQNNPVSEEYTRGIFNEIENSPSQPDRIKDLKEFLTLMDQRRGTDWTKTFPWLVNVK